MNNLNDKFLERYLLENKYYKIKRILFLEKRSVIYREKLELLKKATNKIKTRLESIEFNKEKKKLEILNGLNLDEKNLPLYKLKKKIKSKLKNLAN